METKIDSTMHSATTTGPFVVTDEIDGMVFFADFRDHSDATLTPFDRLNGCMWTRAARNATLFVSIEEAQRALQARSYVNPKRLKIVAAPAEATGSQPPL